MDRTCLLSEGGFRGFYDFDLLNILSVAQHPKKDCYLGHYVDSFFSENFIGRECYDLLPQDSRDEFFGDENKFISDGNVVYVPSEKSGLLNEFDDSFFRVFFGFEDINKEVEEILSSVRCRKFMKRLENLEGRKVPLSVLMNLDGLGSYTSRSCSSGPLPWRRDFTITLKEGYCDSLQDVPFFMVSLYEEAADDIFFSRRHKVDDLATVHYEGSNS